MRLPPKKIDDKTDLTKNNSPNVVISVFFYHTCYILHCTSIHSKT